MKVAVVPVTTVWLVRDNNSLRGHREFMPEKELQNCLSELGTIQLLLVPWYHQLSLGQDNALWKRQRCPFWDRLAANQCFTKLGVTVVGRDGVSKSLHTDINTTEDVNYISKARPRN